MSQLTSPKVVVLLEQPGTDDLMEITVQTDNRDLIQWDVTRGRRSWPAGSEAPMLWMTFLAWHALHRTGGTSLSLDEFTQAAVSISGVKKDGAHVEPSQLSAEDAAVDPTQPGAATGL